MSIFFYQSFVHSGLSGFYCFKKNTSENANASGNKSADDIINNNIEMEEEAPIATISG